MKKAQWFKVLEWFTTALAITGVILNNARVRECFLLWMVSNLATLIIHYRAKLWGLAVRDLVFLVLAIAGWFMWGGA